MAFHFSVYKEKEKKSNYIKKVSIKIQVHFSLFKYLESKYGIKFSENFQIQLFTELKSKTKKILQRKF